MGKTKQPGAASPIVNMLPQELLKSFVKEVGELIDARIRTAEITIKAEIKEVKAAMATKEDIQRLEQKLDKKIDDHEERIKKIEEHLGLTHTS